MLLISLLKKNVFLFFFQQGLDGLEYLIIPLDEATLNEFIEQQEQES